MLKVDGDRDRRRDTDERLKVYTLTRRASRSSSRMGYEVMSRRREGWAWAYGCRGAVIYVPPLFDLLEYKVLPLIHGTKHQLYSNYKVYHDSMLGPCTVRGPV